MVHDAFNLLAVSISQSVEWVDMLFTRLGATMYVVAAAIVVFTIGLLLKPLRGGNIGVVGYSVNKIHDSNKAKAAQAKAAQAKAARPKYTKSKSRKHS